jgi:signal transduction histidine kinase
MTQTASSLAPPARRALPLRFVAGVILALALAMLVFVWVLRPPSGELQAMALFLSITALISVIAGYGAYRLGWLSRSPRLSWTLLAGYGLATVLTFLNVGYSARRMFASQHDLLLAGVLLVFAGGIAMSLGFFVAVALTDRISAVCRGAEAIAEGDLAARVPVEGKDEVSHLARTFNLMAERLQEADRQQRELDTLRRDLIAWVGHDLRTPLASTRVIVEALADGVIDDPETAQRYLRTAQRDIQSLTLLIDDLFDLAQMDAGGLKLERQPTSLAELVADTVESFTALAGQRGVALRGSAEPGIDPVLVDARQIGRVLANLVGNALRHTPAGGAVTVQARSWADRVQVEVADSGDGIPANDLPRVFERFYRGEKSRSRATGGSGLGLAIAKAIVEAHGGQITVESRPGDGARFSFFLPRA